MFTINLSNGVTPKIPLKRKINPNIIITIKLGPTQDDLPLLMLMPSEILPLKISKARCRHPANPMLDKTPPAKLYNNLEDIECALSSKGKLCENDNCKKCYDISFASHRKSTYWSAKNKNNAPRQVLKGSDKKYWFDCNIYQHSFEKTPRGFGEKDVERQRGCTICSKQTLCEIS